MKFVEPRPFANPDLAASKLVEIANSIEAVQDGRIHIERINAPFLAAGGSGDVACSVVNVDPALGVPCRGSFG